jgi:hypothetical protein
MRVVQFVPQEVFHRKEPHVICAGDLFERFDALLARCENQDFERTAREQPLVPAGFLESDVVAELLMLRPRRTESRRLECFLTRWFPAIVCLRRR